MSEPIRSAFQLAIVDDSSDDHYFIKLALKEFDNARIMSFYDGENFLDYLNEVAKKKTDEPDIVLLDINMPKLTGFEVYQKAVQLNATKKTRFYILTTSLTERDKKHCQEQNLQAFIKPASIVGFRQLLRQIVDMSLS